MSKYQKWSCTVNRHPAVNLEIQHKTTFSHCLKTLFITFSVSSSISMEMERSTRMSWRRRSSRCWGRSWRKANWRRSWRSWTLTQTETLTLKVRTRSSGADLLNRGVINLVLTDLFCFSVFSLLFRVCDDALHSLAAETTDNKDRTHYDVSIIPPEIHSAIKSWQFVSVDNVGIDYYNIPCA